MRWLVALACGILLLPAPVRADVFRPAYLDIAQQADESGPYDVLWKVPALDAERMLAITPVFPEGTRCLMEPTLRYPAGAKALRWRIAVPGGPESRTVLFEGRSQSTFRVLVRFRSADGIEQVQRIAPGQSGIVIAPRPGRLAVMASYTPIGIERILGGIDHLLFVLALVLFVRGWRKLLATVATFTLAHSITLALAKLGVVRVPGSPVEAVIALSIVFVACEILRLQRGE